MGEWSVFMRGLKIRKVRMELEVKSIGQSYQKKCVNIKAIHPPVI